MNTPEENLEMYALQLKEFKVQGIPVLGIKLTCGICKRGVGIINLYRCYECGLYICGKCCPDHFGMKPPKRLQTLKRDCGAESTC